MNRHPRDPFDPFDNDNGFDPFNDPFFKQFEQIHQSMFRDFFGDEDRPSIFIQHPNSSKTQAPNHNNAPDLSQINPNAPPTKNHQKNNNANTAPAFFKMFDHFFEPEYDDHKLSDINPNLSDNGPIMNNDGDNKGLIHPNGTPPGFRSPYLPNSSGAEKKMEFGKDNGAPNSFFRSKSVVISTAPNGKTTKTTTIRDSNGVTTNTEEFDANDNGYNNGSAQDMRSIFNWNGKGKDGNDMDAIELFPNQKQGSGYPLFERTHDPFEGFRAKWQNWKWNPSNWYNGYRGGDKQNDIDGGHGHNVYRNRNNNPDDQNKNRNEGIKWQSYRDYKHENQASSLLDDIVKNDD